jgi:hypothetical protein
MSDQIITNKPANPPAQNNNLIWMFIGILVVMGFLFLIFNQNSATTNQPVPIAQETQVPQNPQSTQIPQNPQDTQIPQNPQSTQVPQSPQQTQVPQATTIPLPSLKP